MPSSGKRGPGKKKTGTKRTARSASRSTAKRAQGKRSSDEPKGRPWLRLVVAVGLLGLFVALLLVAATLFNYGRLAARYDVTAVARLPMESVVLDATGEQIGWLHGEDVGNPVPLESVSRYFLDALISREDSRFYRHDGVDRFGLVRAWLRNTKEGQTVQGGSTITMQLTRMTYGLTGRTMHRKLLEIALARRIEKHFSKDEILSAYVNRVFLGTGMNGIEQAAQGYFGKPSSALTLPEAAMIAGVIRAPNGFSPFRSYETALREMRSTLARMVDEGYLGKDEAANLRDARPEVLPQERWMRMLREQSKVSGASYLLELVERKVAELAPSHAGVGGLTVRTTFDTRIQAAAEAALENRLRALEATPGYRHPARGQAGALDPSSGEPRYIQGAVSVVENHSGAVRALVGGRDRAESAFDRSVQARRTMGSIFKPLVYGTAFERGLFPGMLVDDGPIQPGEIAWEEEEWSPENSDGVFGGLLPAADGLIRSRNTMTARVGEWSGIDTVLAMMDLAGLGDPGGKVSPSVYLGSTGASVLDLASAYTVFATGGIRHQPHYLLSIEDRDGTVLFQHEDEAYRVLSSGAAWLTSNILKHVVEDGGTGAGLRELGFAAPAAGKTGTTDDFHDAWFLGYTSRLTAGVWIGLDRPATISEDAYGGKLALPVWHDLMTDAQRIGYEFGPFAEPEEVVEMQLCRKTGLLATDACAAAGAVYVEQVPHDLIPREFCRMH